MGLVIMEKKEKKVKVPKKSKMPEGYIGRPKPMKTKKFVFHKPTVANYIELGIFLAVALFIGYIVFRLVQVAKIVDPDFAYYEIDEYALDEEYILENDELIFTLDPETTQFTVENKETGKVWYSNPEDSNSDPIALFKEKNNMMSTFLLKYSNINGNDDIYDTYSKSIQNSFYSIEQEDDEILVHYTIGDIEREYILPLAIYEDEMLAWQEDLTRSQIRSINNAYHKYDPETIDDDEYYEMVEKYPEFEDQPIYIIFENTKTYIKEQVEAIFADQGYEMEDYNRHKELYKESVIQEVPAFNLTVSYRLEDNGLVVEIPFDEISFKHTYPIVQLSVLPYFGAGSTEEEGFMFVPEGGGNIIDFNNGKINQNGYYADVYGWDYATDRKSVNTETRVAYPVFGVSHEDESFICIIEEGAPYAGITADIAGKLGSYNYVHSDYKMLHREQFDISSRNVNAQFSYENSLPEGEVIRQIYKFQTTGDIVSMAEEYRDYLFGDEEVIENSQVPLAIDIIGSIDKVQQVAGIPKTMPYSLTTYKQAAEIINDIEALNVDNTNIRLSGFINEGIHQTFLKKVKFINELGGKRGFNKLLKKVSDSSSNIYLDSAVQTAYRSTMLGEGFNKYTHSARFASDELCKLYQYSPLWYGKAEYLDSYYLLKPKFIDKNTKKFIKTLEKKNLNVSFADVGYLLSSDFDKDSIVTRASARDQQLENLNTIKENGKALMIRGGNDYAALYADFITNLDLSGNKYAIFDRKVPFYQMVLHGYRNYSGAAVNLSEDMETLLLESAETGAGLFFTFTGENAEKIQETRFTEYYSTYYDSWKENFVEIYNEYNKNISKVADSIISDYENLSDKVTKTTFENGYAVYVNFDYVDFETESGETIAARDYVVMKVEE